MAKSRNRTKRNRAGGEGWSSNEALGILFIGTGLLLFLSLVSYTPGDLPMRVPGVGWTWLEAYALETAPNVPRHNFIGPVGALFGFAQIQLLGAAAYLLPIGLVWMAVAKLFMEARFTWRTWAGLGVFLVSGACLLGVHDMFFGSWPARYVIVGPGGAIGNALGASVFKGLFNTLGALIVLGMIYAVSLVLLLGAHPVKFLKEAYFWAVETGQDLWARYRDARAAPKSARRTAAKPAAPPAARRRRPEPEPEPEDLEEEYEEEEYEDEEEFETDEVGQAQLPLVETPQPQIIDATQRIAPKMELGAKPFERRKPQHASISTEGFENYDLPGFDLLDYDDDAAPQEDHSHSLRAQQGIIVETLRAFGVEVTPGDITRGPTITRYEVYPSIGLRVSRIAQLEPDIARATKAERINILAPIPGKDTVGIEIANDIRMPVALRELCQDDAFRSSKKKIPLALGKDVYGKSVIGDLAAMPHLLVAGATGSGKSVCINSIIASMLFKFGPDELRFIMIDPKVVEMQMYANLPHLVVPVVTDPRKVVGALKWCVNEMERRYKIFAKEGVRNFDSFNNRVRHEDALELEAGEEENAEEDYEEEEYEEEEYEEEEYEEGEEYEDGEEYEEGEDGEEYEEEDGEEYEEGEDGEEYEEEEFEAEDDAEFEAGGDAGEEEGAGGEEVEDEEVDDAHLDSIAAALTDGELGPEALGEELEDEEEEIPDRFPYIVVIIDELADLMQTAPADVEMCIARIAQKARAAGIHLIVATQTPRADVVTGIIKANIPSRIAFQVSSALDSRVILDTKGAEKLVGKGDLLFLPPGSAKLERAQGAFVSDEEVENIVKYCSAQVDQQFEAAVQASIESGGSGEDGGDEEVCDADEEILQKCMEVVLQERKASTSLLQRRLRLGYTRAARMMDILEQRGVIGPADGAKPREVYVKRAAVVTE